jgi:hypothetical protein
VEDCVRAYQLQFMFIICHDHCQSHDVIGVIDL